MAGTGFRTLVSRSLFSALSTFAVILLEMSLRGSTSSSIRGQGHLCEDDPKCICLQGETSWRHCEGEVDVRRTEGSLQSTGYALECFRGAGVEAYRHLSLMTSQRENVRGAKLEVGGCPPPNQSYASLIKLKERNQEEQTEHGYLVRLIINCSGVDEFILDGYHLDRLQHLQLLGIVGPSMSNLSVGLLSGISRNISQIYIEDTSVETLPNGFFSGLARLRSISLRRNRLKRFQGSLLRESRIVYWLDLAENRIDYLDEDMFVHTPGLLTLNISRNRITDIPPSLCCLRGLRELYAGDNRIGFIPPNCLQNIVTLQDLRMQGNRLVNLDSSWNEMSKTTAGLKWINGDMHGLFRSTSDRDIRTNSSVSGRGDSRRFLLSTMDSRRRDVQLPLQNSTASGRHPIPEYCYPYANDSLNFWMTYKEFADSEASTFGRDFVIGADITQIILSASLKEVRGKELERALDLSKNNISRIYPDSFAQNFKVTVLRLSDNLLTDASDTLLLAHTNLAVLDLSGNQISTLAASFFSNGTKLEEIDLSNNRLYFLPEDIFRPFNNTGGNDLKSSLELNLEGNLLESLPAMTLPRLKVLKLSRNRLTHIRGDFLDGLPKLEKLDLSHNLIERFRENSNWKTDGLLKIPFGRPPIRMTEIDLSGNRLTDFPFNGPTSRNILALNLSGNRLQASGFDCHPSVSVCAWDMNAVKNVKHLDLSRNGMKLPECRAHMYPERKTVGCRTFFFLLSKLQTFLLSHNEIEYVPVDLLHDLPSLRLADLSHNKIKRLWNHDILVSNGLATTDLRFLKLNKDDYLATHVAGGDTYYEFPNTYHRTIDLRHNQIDSVVLPKNQLRVVPQDCTVEKQFARTTILLGGNPLVCGCNSLKLLQYSQQEVRPTAELERLSGSRLILPAKVDIQGLHCAEPQSVAGKAFSEPETWMHHLLPMLCLCNSVNEGQEPWNTARGQWGTPRKGVDPGEGDCEDCSGIKQ